MCAGILIGLARGGRVEGLSRVRFRGGAAILALFLMQMLARQVLPGFLPLTSRASVWLWCGIVMGLLLVCALNWRIAGILLLVLGLSLNLLVVVLNAGMPVGGPLADSARMTPSAADLASSGGFYRPVESGTIAKELADVIPIPQPAPLRSLLSLGDIIMFSGAAVLIERAVRDGRYRARHAARAG